MRIVIDMQGAQTPGSRNRGIGRYTRSFVKSLILHQQKHEIVLALNGSFYDSMQDIKAQFHDLLPSRAFRTWYPIGPVDFFDRSNMQRRLAAEAHRELFIEGLDPDVLVITSLFEGFGDEAVGSIGALSDRYPKCAILYDLIPLIFGEEYLGDLNIKRWYANRLDHLRNADAILAISESSRQEAVKYLNFSSENAIYIGSDVDPHFKKIRLPKNDFALLKYRHGICKQFIMYTGGIDHRKNVEALIRSFCELPPTIRDSHQLAIVCSVDAAEKARLLLFAKEFGMPDDGLLITGFVSEEDLVALYSYCKLFVFPSLHEGFGLPILEAMRCGAAVIGSDRSSIPEIVGFADALFDPNSVSSMSKAMASALDDPEKLKALRRNAGAQSAKFSWETTAKRAISGMEILVEKFNIEKFRATKIRPSLAFVSPFPPAHSGIADFSLDLLVELNRYYRIDLVYVSGQPPLDAKMPISLRGVDHRNFGRNWRSYDRILYQLGNSSHHEHMFELLEKTGGVAVLHDFYLSHLLEYREAITPPHVALWIELYRSHGYPALVARARAHQLEDIVWEYPCSRQVFDWADGVIVHSQHAATLVSRWYGDTVGSQVEVVPLLRSKPSNRNGAAARDRLSLHRDLFVVCSFGMIGPSKLTHHLVETWAEGGFANRSDCCLILVGENCGGSYGEKIRQYIDEYGLTNVEITGWVEEAEYDLYLKSANMAIQLRTMSRGETSAAVLDCLNFGVPTIVNANGSMADLPPSSVLILPDQFEKTELIQAIQNLMGDRIKRDHMSANAIALVEERHSAYACALEYRAAVERIYSRPIALAGFHRSMIRLEVDPVTMITVAERITRDLALPEGRLYIDISLLAQFDARTGIQRVVRNILRELVSDEYGLRIEPCYFDHSAGRFRFARSFMASFLKVRMDSLSDDIISVGPFDTILFLDLNPEGLQDARGYLHEVQRAGARLAFVVYDLIPIKYPRLFAENVSENYKHWLQLVLSSDVAICISASVASDLAEFARQQDREANCEIGHFPLGSDFHSDHGSVEKFAHAGIGLTSDRPTFLMVGTIEPRKGHATVLDAFERLWAQGEDVGLIIVGKEGWLVRELVNRIERVASSEERFQWRADVGDVELTRLYTNSTCLIAASLDEGFGLPLIEAAHFGLPIIARDIPVFREVGGDNVAYFPAFKGAESLADFITRWLGDWRNGVNPRSSGIQVIDWKESARELLSILSRP